MKKLLPNLANRIQLTERVTNKLSRLPSNDKCCLLRPSIMFFFFFTEQVPAENVYNKQPPAEAKKQSMI